MKKNLIKKVFAVSLSIAMACSFLPAANPVTASAAAPYVSLKTTFKTLKVNQSYKMTLKNNTINWKIKKVETTAKAIATVYGKTTSQVMIKGKSEGRATIRVRLTTSKRKTNNTKTLRCRVKVVPAATTDPTTPVQTDATVTTQAELNTALADTNITKITIRPTTAENFVIAQGSYSNVDLIVDAPLSDIENNAVFKSITINNIKAETWTEKASGNTFSILAKAARLVVDRAASVKDITIGTADSKVDVVVNGGTVGSVNVTAKTTLNITGEAAANAALIPVTFGVGAADSTFVTELPAAVSMSANVELTFEKGAVKSTVKLEVAGIKAIITNNTAEAIVVTKNDGKTTQNILAGAQKATANAVSTTTTTPGSSSGNTGSSTIVKPVTPYRIDTGSAIQITVSGSAYGAEVVSNGSLGVRVAGLTTTPSAIKVPVGYTVTAVQTGDNSTVFRKTIGSGTLEGMNVGSSEKPAYEYYTSGYEYFDISGIKTNVATQFVISFYVKETDKEAGSVAVQATTTSDLTFAPREYPTGSNWTWEAPTLSSNVTFDTNS